MILGIALSKLISFILPLRRHSRYKVVCFFRLIILGGEPAMAGLVCVFFSPARWTTSAPAAGRGGFPRQPSAMTCAEAMRFMAIHA